MKMKMKAIYFLMGMEIEIDDNLVGIVGSFAILLGNYAHSEKSRISW